MKKVNNNVQKSTVSAETGLTPIQEQACIMLASGESITTVADKLSVNRGTLYKWQDDESFECFFNQQRQDYKNDVRNGLLGLHRRAINAVSELLDTGNDNTRLKLAMWILDKVENMGIGATRIRSVLKDRCAYYDDLQPRMSDTEYQRLLNEYGLADVEV